MVTISGTLRGFVHTLKQKLHLGSRKNTPQSTANSRSTLPAPTAPAASSPPSTTSASQPPLSPPLPQHGITAETPLQNASSTTVAPYRSLWQRAYSIAKDQLSENERKQFDLSAAGNDSIESAISAAKDAQKAAKEKRWVYRNEQGNEVVVMERVGKILRGMETYAKVVDILVQSSPKISALVWGSARFILQVSLPPIPACSI